MPPTKLTATLPNVLAASVEVHKELAARPHLQPVAAKLATAAAACQQTLAVAGPQAQAQALLQVYARVQALQGLPLGLSGAAATRVEQMAKVLAAIEAVAGAAMPQSAADGAKLQQASRVWSSSACVAGLAHPPRRCKQ